MKKTVFAAQEISKCWWWRDGLVVKMKGLALGPRTNIRQPDQMKLQPSVTFASRNPMPSSGLCEHQVYTWHICPQIYTCTH